MLQGIFSELTRIAKESNNGQNIPLWQKAACGLAAGGLGALVGTPADLTLIRMQADSTLPVEQRRNYKGVGDAMVRAYEQYIDSSSNSNGGGGGDSVTGAVQVPFLRQSVAAAAWHRQRTPGFCHECDSASGCDFCMHAS